MSRFAKQLAAVVADKVVAQNVDFLTEDFQPTREGTRIRITLAVDSAVAVRLSPSSGSTTKIQSSALGAEVLETFEFDLDPSLSYNLSTPDAAGTTINYLVINEVEA